MSKKSGQYESLIIRVLRHSFLGYLDNFEGYFITNFFKVCTLVDKVKIVPTNTHLPPHKHQVTVSYSLYMHMCIASTLYSITRYFALHKILFYWWLTFFLRIRVQVYPNHALVSCINFETFRPPLIVESVKEMRILTEMRVLTGLFDIVIVKKNKNC